MASFQYTAITATGERVRGVLSGASEQAVLAELEARRLTPVSIGEHGPRALGLPGRARVRGHGVRVSARQLAMAYGQLSDLLRAGVPLMRGLRLLAGRKSRRGSGVARVFGELAEAVGQGTDLADAMADRERTFPKIHVAMIRAGERGGFLEAVLARLGRFLVAQADMRAKVLGNLIYPALLVVFGTLALVVVTAVFVPKVKPIFAKLEAAGKLPTVTRVVIGVGDGLTAYGLWVGLAAAAIGAAAWWAARRPGVDRRVAAAAVRAPIVGPIIRAMAVSRFCRILGTMLANAIPLLAAMRIARDAAGNVLMEEAIDRATEAVRAGQPLAGPLAESGLFPDDVVEMIAVGESANNLDEVLVTIAETVEARLDRMLTVAVKLIEPAMLLLLAVVIGVVAVALILPMSQMSQALR